MPGANPRGDFWWQLLAELLIPPLDLVIALTDMLRPKETDVNSDPYYQPPECLEQERVLYCYDCDQDTMHLLLDWRDGCPTRECLVCFTVLDYEVDE